MARRLVERGVRFVELFDSDWDHHTLLYQKLPGKCREVDQPVAALIKDLEERGLLDETIVVFAGEFGRTPMAQTTSGDGVVMAPGRDHHRDAFTVLVAGGGMKAGLVYGSTDDFGFSITENPVHVHDLQATLLHLLGVDHERLTYFFMGREFRLTDVAGEVVPALIS
jgi:arylsulfatase A-like enzyme